MLGKNKLLAVTLSTILVASILTGCGNGSPDNSAVNTTDQNETTAKAESIADYKGSTFTGRVTSVDGNEITLSIGGGPIGKMGQRPEQNTDDNNQTSPDMDNSNGEKPTPPDINSDDDNNQIPPDIDNSNGEMPTPPDINSDNNDMQKPQESSSSDDNSSSDKKQDRKNRESKTITFTVDDESVLEDITMSDITDDTRLTVTVDDSGNISKITQSSDNMGPGGKGERPEKGSNKS